MGSLPPSQDVDALPGILDEIVRAKRDEVARLAQRDAELRSAAASAPDPRDFRAALGRTGSVSLIAECKRRSPGAGDIRPGLDPVALTSGYEQAGAAALSVLTDAAYFGGSLDDLRAVTRSSGLPVLRKDFTLDPVQVYEARAASADAVLLIARILPDGELAALQALARDLGMAALVEVHDGDELARALDLGADPIGINNRDLSTFETDLETTLALAEEVPRGVVLVSESGIHTRDDVARLGTAGVDAILVGEALLRADDPRAAAAALVGVSSGGRCDG